MRKLTVTLPAAAVIAAAAVAALQTGASASTTAPAMIRPPGGSPSTARTAISPDPGLSFTTRMISYKAIDVPPAGLSAGDEYVLAGRVIRHDKADGLSTAQCTYTVTSGPVLRVCTVDYALDNGLIITSGYINSSASGAPVTLVVDGGTGAYRNVRGYGLLQPTSTGSNVTLHLTS
jgi:hypothetical protein